MSRSHGDRRGKQINSEINGRGCLKVVGVRLVAVCGGEVSGNPARKRDAKQLATRLRRQGARSLMSKISADLGA